MILDLRLAIGLLFRPCSRLTPHASRLTPHASRTNNHKP